MHVQSPEYINYCLLCPEAIPSTQYSLDHHIQSTFEIENDKPLASFSIPLLHPLQTIMLFFNLNPKEGMFKSDIKFQMLRQSLMLSLTLSSQEFDLIGWRKTRHTANVPSVEKKIFLNYPLLFPQLTRLPFEGWTI